MQEHGPGRMRRHAPSPGARDCGVVPWVAFTLQCSHNGVELQRLCGVCACMPPIVLTEDLLLFKCVLRLLRREAAPVAAALQSASLHPWLTM